MTDSSTTSNAVVDSTVENPTVEADTQVKIFSLFAYITGSKIFPQENLHYTTKPVVYTATIDLNDDFNSRVDEHILLTSGVPFDRIHKITMIYKDNATTGRLVCLPQEDNTWNVTGNDNNGNPIDCKLTKTSKDENGKHITVDYTIPEDSPNMRYPVRDMIFKLRKLMLFVDRTPSAEKTRVLKAELEKENSTLKDTLKTQAEELEALRLQMAELMARMSESKEK